MAGGQKKTKIKQCNKFNKDFKNGPHLKNKTKHLKKKFEGTQSFIL